VRLEHARVILASAALLPAALRRFAADRPGVGVVFEEDVTARLLSRVREGELDVAVVTDHPPGLPVLDGLELVRLLDDPLCLLLPAGHRLADREVAALREVRPQAARRAARQAAPPEAQSPANTR